MPTLLLVLLHPYRAAERLRRSPRWLGAFLALAGGLVALRWVSHSHLVESTLAALPVTASAVDRSWTRSILDTELLLRCAFLPLRQLAGMAAFALVLYWLCTAFDPPVRARFKQVFALEIHAEVFNMIGGWAAFALTMLASNANLSGTCMLALLTSAKIFTLGYVVALTAGLPVLFGFSKLKAGLLASTAWTSATLFNAFLLQAVSASLHFRV